MTRRFYKHVSSIAFLVVMCFTPLPQNLFILWRPHVCPLCPRRLDNNNVVHFPISIVRYWLSTHPELGKVSGLQAPLLQNKRKTWKRGGISQKSLVILSWQICGHSVMTHAEYFSVSIKISFLSGYPNGHCPVCCIFFLAEIFSKFSKFVKFEITELQHSHQVKPI